MNPRKWQEKQADPDLQKRLAHALRIHPITAAILIRRGISNEAPGRAFLNPGTDSLLDPSDLPDISFAVERIRSAVTHKKQVAIYGDYDVDGITATSLYLRWFQLQDCPVTYYIPDRIKEGYGLNPQAIHSLHDQGIDLVITADCGTTSIPEIELAQSLGLDVIVTDHHENLPGSKNHGSKWPVVNPKRPDSKYGFDGLCTAGIAYKLIQVLNHEVGGPARDPAEGLDLVALGTLADVSPMMGENRYLVSEGLNQINQGGRPGIKALKAVAGVDERPVGCGTVGFVLAPRINAVGRLADARDGVRLLTTESIDEAERISFKLEGLNRERQQIEQKIMEEAETLIQQEIDLAEDACLVLASADWHVGVVGIGASRLVERYGRPCILIALDENGVGRGSARSTPGYHIQEGLGACADILLAFGGHKQAAGLSIKKENIPALRKRLSEQVWKSMGDSGFGVPLRVDATVELGDLNYSLIQEFGRLRPHGIGNPEPTLVVRDVIPISPRVVGQNHLKMKVKKRGALIFDAIGFRMGNEVGRLEGKSRVNLAFTPEFNNWQGREQIQLRIKDIQFEA